MTQKFHYAAIAGAAALGFLNLLMLPLHAAELQVFGVAPVRSTITALSKAYAQSSSQPVNPTIVASDIVEQSLAGKSFDVMVLSSPEMDEQQKAGRIQGGAGHDHLDARARQQQPFEAVRVVLGCPHAAAIRRAHDHWRGRLSPGPSPDLRGLRDELVGAFVNKAYELDLCDRS